MIMNTLEEHLDATSYNTAYNVRLRLALRGIHAIPPLLCPRSSHRPTSIREREKRKSNFAREIEGVELPS